VQELAAEYAGHFLLSLRDGVTVREIRCYSLVVFDEILKLIRSMTEKQSDLDFKFHMNKLTLHLFEVLVHCRGNKEDKIRYYDKIHQYVPVALASQERLFDDAIERDDLKFAKTVFHDLSLMHGDVLERFHEYRRILLEHGLI